MKIQQENKKERKTLPRNYLVTKFTKKKNNLIRAVGSKAFLIELEPRKENFVDS